jgi:hypothetical protein
MIVGLFLAILQSMDITAIPATPELLDQVRGKSLLKHYSMCTGQAYMDWINQFILHFGKRHPDEPGAPEVDFFDASGRSGQDRSSPQERKAIVLSGVFAAPL